MKGEQWHHTESSFVLHRFRREVHQELLHMQKPHLA